MGCIAKTKQIANTHVHHLSKERTQSNSFKQNSHSLGCILVEKDYREHLPPLELTYLKKKYKDVCGDLTKKMSPQQFYQYFSALDFHEQTLSELYEQFCKKYSVDILNFEILKKNIEEIVCLQTSQQLIKGIYKIYFKNKGQRLKTFAHQFVIFLYDDGESLDQGSARIRGQLSPLVDQGLDEKNCKILIEWMLKNLDMLKFRSYWLFKNLEEDEKLAYSMYLHDKQSKEYTQKQGAIINKYWVDKMVAFFSSKYKILNQKRKSPEDSKGAINLIRVKNMSLLKINSTKKSHFVQQSTIVKREDDQWSTTVYPGAIDNYSIAGNFEWELRKGMRLNLDYEIVSPQTFHQMQIVFGGNPSFIREIIGGYIHLESYHVIVYSFMDNNLYQKEMLTFRRADSLWKLYQHFPKEINLFHRNPGWKWEKLSKQDTESSQICQFFNETSFIAKVEEQDIHKFAQYLKHRRISKIPVIGEIYKNSTKNPDEYVCIIRELHEQKQTCFNILNNVFSSRKTSFKNFSKNYELDESKSQIKISTFEAKKGGICNLGNTCYLSAGIQGLIALRSDNHLFLRTKPFGAQIMEIIDKIQNKKIDAYPLAFKNLLDSKYRQFAGQQQCDALTFLSKVLEALEQENPQEYESHFLGQIETKTICKACQNFEVEVNRSNILTLPLRDFKKKTVRIDHVLKNTTIQTVTFEIEEDATAMQWIKNFQIAAHAKRCQYFQLKRSELQRNFTRQWLQYRKFSDLNISPSDTVYAYELKLYESTQTLHHSAVFKIYSDNNKKFIAQVKQSIKQIPQEYQTKGTPNGETQDSPNSLFSIKIKEGRIFRKIQVMDFELSKYPINEQSQKNDIVVSVINFDNYFKETIGHPFLILTKKFYPISAIRHYIQEQMGMKQHCYLKLVVNNRMDICELCGKYRCQERCFEKNEEQFPIEWFEETSQFLLVWDSYNDYAQHITKKSFDHSKTKANNLELDTLSLSLQNFSKEEFLLKNCQYCKTKNTRFSSQQKIIKWPSLLILHLSRFKIREGIAVKNHTKWKLQEIVEIDHIEYRLKAVILHSGESISCGCFSVVIDNFKYDDKLVTPLRYEDIQPQDIYILMYAAKPRLP